MGTFSVVGRIVSGMISDRIGARLVLAAGALCTLCTMSPITRVSLIAAGCPQISLPFPWLGGMKIRFDFGS
jgi:nitrate/nitrite transporter NarK